MSDESKYMAERPSISSQYSEYSGAMPFNYNGVIASPTPQDTSYQFSKSLQSNNGNNEQKGLSRFSLSQQLQFNGSGPDTSALGQYGSFPQPNIILQNVDHAKSVVIDIPTDDSGNPLNANWYVLNICVNGEPKKIKVLSTNPY